MTGPGLPGARPSRRGTSGLPPGSGFRRGVSFSEGSVHVSLHRSLSLVWLLVAPIVVRPALAAGAPQGPDTGQKAPPVEALVERALAQAPSLAARRARVDAAQAAVR